MFEKVLIIDDDQLFCQSLKEDFQERGLIAHTLNEIDSETLQLYSEVSFDIILLDLRLKHILGTSHISELKKIWNDATIIVMTGFGTISSAVDAIKKGANEYITKPVSFEKICELLDKDDSLQKDDEAESISTLDRIEREYIEYVLSKENGNISKAAKKLGLHRQSLQRKLKKWVPFK